MHVLALLLAVAQPVVPEDRAATAAAILKARADIRTFHAVVHFDMTVLRNGGDPDAQDREKAVYEVWMDGALIRYDMRKTESSYDAKGVGMRRIVCRNCERSGYAMENFVADAYISSVRFTKIDRTFDEQDMIWFDWKNLGVLNGDLSYYRNSTRPESELNVYRDDSTQVEQPLVDGHNGVRWTRTSKSGARASCLLSSAAGWHPVRYELVAAGRIGGQTTDITYPQQPVNGVWYPASTRHVRTIGGRTTLDERVEVKTVEINGRIDPAVFTLAGLGLRDGTPIEFPEIKRQNDQPTWRDGRLDTKNTLGVLAAEAYYKRLEKEPSNPVPDMPEPGRRWPYLLAAAAAAVVGLAALLAVRRRRGG